MAPSEQQARATTTLDKRATADGGDGHERATSEGSSMGDRRATSWRGGQQHGRQASRAAQGPPCQVGMGVGPRREARGPAQRLCAPRPTLEARLSASADAEGHGRRAADELRARARASDDAALRSVWTNKIWLSLELAPMIKRASGDAARRGRASASAASRVRLSTACRTCPLGDAARRPVDECVRARARERVSVRA